MTPAGEKIAAVIRKRGPITVERYWNLALFDPEHGYYAVRDPIGRAGDFTTAPEISQMFGELLAAWMLAAWRDLGSPAPFVFAEIGPGRGTLMADMLRTLRSLDRDFLKAARVCLVETSDRLARLQSERLAGFDLPIRHLRRIEEADRLPLFLVANELFDAIAIRQFIFTRDGWRERAVCVEGSGFRFVEVTPAGWPLSYLERFGIPFPGAICEVSPARLAVADAVAARVAGDGGAALVIDYGHSASGFGDTLQAVRGHAFADPLREPGLADITSHVDFHELGRRFLTRGNALAPAVAQGEFLMSLGLRARASALGMGKLMEEQAAIVAAARRLAGTAAGEMGRLFKVLAAASRPLHLPPFERPATS